MRPKKPPSQRKQAPPRYFHVGLNLIDPPETRERSRINLMKVDLSLNGQTHFIKLVPSTRDRFRIIDGAVRYLAARELDWVSIKGVVYFDGDK